MFTHADLGSNDIEKSRKFYDATMAELGYRNVVPPEAPNLVYAGPGGTFIVGKPYDGQPATIGNGSTLGFAAPDDETVSKWHAAGIANGGTIGFQCDSPDQVKQFHDVAVANGGTSIEDPPGLRDGALGAIHLAYVRDPDGNKLCALYRVPKE